MHAGASPPAAHACDAPAARNVRQILDRIADKWSLQVIACLAEGPLRFGELRRRVEGVSQRMLTVTLRALERDGIATRTVLPTAPPSVEYALTPLGTTLLDLAASFVTWADTHFPDVEAARAAYDTRAAASVTRSGG
ncbi:winged helix-turn-helix transcriptional regulator [Actinomadura flavalba]|uniref:winged helix-turn-helix transcriptional regulator n=1 Tax=Actinomadura flavalba TaxID=1120938 RepID=UPI0003716B83|nr:helix-turn-helix domain-containing protein [Actinomadura flavalba]